MKDLIRTTASLRHQDRHRRQRRTLAALFLGLAAIVTLGGATVFLELAPSSHATPARTPMSSPIRLDACSRRVQEEPLMQQATAPRPAPPAAYIVITVSKTPKLRQEPAIAGNQS